MPVQPTTPLAPVVIEVFSRESQNLIAWALSPLEEIIPADIRQNLTFIREDLVDEGKAKPAASLDAYRAAFYLCEDLLTALNERDKARAASGYRAALREAETNKADVKKERLKVEWATRAEQMRQHFDTVYRQLREAMR
jgi:hypothetical protein